MRRTAPGKLRAPLSPPSMIARPKLDSRLDGAFSRTLTSVVAGAGFGKSTLLSHWASRRGASWYALDESDVALDELTRGIIDAISIHAPSIRDELAPSVLGSSGPDADHGERARAQAIASLLCELLLSVLEHDVAIVLDDLHEIGTSPGPVALLEGLCREAPPGLHLVVSSRTDLPFPVERLRGRGHVLELGAGDLAFGLDEVAALLDPDEANASVIADLHRATRGWPAAVRMAVEALRSSAAHHRAASVRNLGRSGGALFAYLAREVYDREPQRVRDLVRTVSCIQRFSAELCTALGLEDAGDTITSLARRGIFLEPRGAGSSWHALSELVREFVSDYAPLGPDEQQRVYRTSAQWFESNGHIEEALRSLAMAADHEGLAHLVLAHGDALTRLGAADAVIDASARLPRSVRDKEVERIEGEARQVRGDWDTALACYERATAGEEALSAGMAWRMGLIHHLRGDLATALEIYARGSDDSKDPRESALLLAWTATAHWLRGETDACRSLSAQAFDAARKSDDPQALAAAHTILGMLAATDGDRRANLAHYHRGLQEAERAHDTLHVIRIRTNIASHHIEEGAYDEGLEELHRAIRAADASGYGGTLAVALNNRADARLARGALDDAVADYTSARSILQRLGSQLVCYPLVGLGDVYRERGDLATARAHYQDALDIAERSGNVQGLVPALAGLARALAQDDPAEARRLADRAVACAPGLWLVGARLASGWAALADGDLDRTLVIAAEAASAARAQRSRPALAEALELQASASPPDHGRPLLEEAIAIWRDIRNPLGEARATLSLARVVEGPSARALAVQAEQSLRELGARGHAAEALAFIGTLDRRAQSPVAIYALGGFRILRAGSPVPASQWQSRKARDLLKMLVARRSRPVPREALMEALWPREDPAKLGNRLSVALATVRSVLDPDRRFDAEHFVTGDREHVALDLDHVWVDVNAFLDDGALGLSLFRDGRRTEALERLIRAEATYAGDFLEEDYEDWSVATREEARATYVNVARVLAVESASSGDSDAAVRYYLRILERDAHDEQAHLGLVRTLEAAGRRGEARRYYRAYVARMDEIGVEAAPFPR